MKLSVLAVQSFVQTCCLALVSVHGRAEQPCLHKAWLALNRADYSTAIEAANECIAEFGPKAFREQKSLQASGEKEPPIGSVDNVADKKKVFDRWAVNDVATAYFVKGRAAEHLFRSQKADRFRRSATEAYEAAAKLTFGRCWDPQGWFWSPSEGATDRLSALR